MIHSTQERNDFEKFDKEHNVRSKMIDALKEKFGHLGLTYSIGGQISFDVFPTGQSIPPFCLKMCWADTPS